VKDRPARPTRVVRWHGPIDIVEVRDLLAEHTSFGGDFLGEVEIRCANKRCGIDVAILRISDIWAKRVRVIRCPSCARRPEVRRVRTTAQLRADFVNDVVTEATARGIDDEALGCPSPKPHPTRSRAP